MANPTLSGNHAMYVDSLIHWLRENVVHPVGLLQIGLVGITYLLAKDWLSNFSYQIDMPAMPFVIATLISVIIALLTVSVQSYLAATSDPVEAIKYE